MGNEMSSTAMESILFFNLFLIYFQYIPIVICVMIHFSNVHKKIRVVFINFSLTFLSRTSIQFEVCSERARKKFKTM